jgi:hypothetical protein
MSRVAPSRSRGARDLATVHRGVAANRRQRRCMRHRLLAGGSNWRFRIREYTCAECNVVALDTELVTTTILHTLMALARMQLGRMVRVRRVVPRFSHQLLWACCRFFLRMLPGFSHELLLPSDLSHAKLDIVARGTEQSQAKQRPGSRVEAQGWSKQEKLSVNCRPGRQELTSTQQKGTTRAERPYTHASNGHTRTLQTAIHARFSVSIALASKT